MQQVHALQFYRIEDFDQDVFQHTDEGEVGKKAETEVALENMFILLRLLGNTIQLPLRIEIPLDIPLRTIALLTNDSPIGAPGRNFMIRDTNEIRELNTECIHPFGRVDFVHDWIVFGDFAILVLALENEDVAVQFLVVFEDHLVYL